MAPLSQWEAALLSEASLVGKGRGLGRGYRSGTLSPVPSCPPAARSAFWVSHEVGSFRWDLPSPQLTLTSDWGNGTLQPVLRRDWHGESEVFSTNNRHSVPPTLCFGDSWTAPGRVPSSGEGGPSPVSFPSAAPFDVSPFFRMEKLGNEIATLFTHSHIVSLVVSSQLSSSSPFPPAIQPFRGSMGITVSAAAGSEAFPGAWRRLHVLPAVQTQTFLLL